MNQDPKMQGDNPSSDNNQPTTGAGPDPTASSRNTPQATPSPAENLQSNPSANSENVQYSQAPITATQNTVTNNVTPAAPTNGPIPQWMSASDGAGSMVEPAAAPKKKHAGLIITIIILLLIIIAGAACAVWYFLIYSQPERVAYDAIDNFISGNYIGVSSIAEDGSSTGKGLVLAGNAVIEHDFGNDGEGAASLRLTANLGGMAAHASGTSQLTLTLNALDQNQEVIGDAISVQLGNVLLQDGKIYLQISQISEAFESIVTNLAIAGEVDESLIEQVTDFFTEIDGEWWEINVPDLLDELAGNDVDPTPEKELYACCIDLNNQDYNKELAELYRKYPFVNIKRLGVTINAPVNSYTATGGYNYYDPSLDYDLMAEFINALPKTEVAGKAYDCINHYIASKDNSTLDPSIGSTYDEDLAPPVSPTAPKEFGPDDFNKVTPDQLRDYFDIDAEVYLEISNFGHELRSIIIESSQEKTKISGQLIFNYQDVKVAAPDNHRSITDLIEKIEELIITGISNVTGESWQYDPETGSFYSVEEVWAAENEEPIDSNQKDDGEIL